jgi:hypothetical protein
MRTGGEGARRFAANLEQDFARSLGWGASPPSCSRSAHPAWPASREAPFSPGGEERKREREKERGASSSASRRGLYRLEGKKKRRRKEDLEALAFLFKKEKPSTS